MNMIDWLRASAEWMVKDRPENYASASHALSALNDMVETIRINPDERAGIEIGGLILLRSHDDGVEEWTLSKKISSFVVFEEEGEADAYGWTKEVDLPNIED